MGARAFGYSLIGAIAASLLASASVVGSGVSAQARLVRINADPPTVVDLGAFGPSGPYLKISGTFDGELDPLDPHNEPIADIGLAPRRDGKVPYTSTFYVLRPLDLGLADLFGRGRLLAWALRLHRHEIPPVR